MLTPLGWPPSSFSSILYTAPQTLDELIGRIQRFYFLDSILRGNERDLCNCWISTYVFIEQR
jgi:hypothetical protein